MNIKTKKLKIFQAARGYFGRRKNCWAIAVRAVHKGWEKAFIGRKLKKREFRAQWIQQINAGARQHGVCYSKLMKAMPVAGIQLNRKVLADIAGTEPYSFRAVIEAAKLAVPDAFKKAISTRRPHMQ